VRRQSFEEREKFLKEAGLEGNMKFQFEFDKESNAGSLQRINPSYLQSKDKLNRSHDVIWKDKAHQF
jgi:hypothetical protein